MNKKIVLATSNDGKRKEVMEILAPLGYVVLTLEDVGLQITAEETSDTYEGNALIKARNIAERCSYPVLSDDSGLSITALNGFPGVHSARFMEGHPYPEKCRAILALLKDKTDRSATYYDVMAFIDKKQGIEKTFFGKTEGQITLTYDDKAPYGFGYDPIFFSDDLQQTFGRVPDAEKNPVSHRGRALTKVLEFLSQKEVLS